ncbi:MAG TPA: FGGY family carbohydrate kinase, partial [Candidatus Limnocylindrales bacterium]|nr:FGGY family carbohydrate kinase [Candidatus Limnocylindrales bacterium]
MTTSEGVSNRQVSIVVYVLGVDLGTQSLKVLALDEAGRVRARAAATYPVSYPRPGWAEQDPCDWEAALAEALGRLLDESGIRGAEIGGIGVAAQVDGVVAVDDANRPLGPAPIWSDRRATEETARLAERVDRTSLRETTGLNLDASHVAPKIAWLRAAGDARRSAAAYLLPGSYLVARLTGARVVDHANASSTLLYDIRARDWSEALLGATRIEPGLLAPIAVATEVAGGLTPRAADRLGLPRGCPVAVGTGDEHAAALAAGALEPGIVCDIAGTAEPVGVAAREPRVDPSGLVETHAHVPVDRWLVENPGWVSGGSVRWLADVLGVDQATVIELAAGAPPGAEGVTFLPTLGGSVAPRWNDRVRGAFAGLTAAHGRSHLARAVLEGCAFPLRDVVDRLADLGLGGEAIRVAGGGARSGLWLQIKADVTGRPVVALAEPEVTALGGAIVAA